MASILDLGTVLMPQGTYSMSQSFPGIQVHPRQLPTTMVTVTLQTPPVAGATFVAEVASTQAGVYSEVGRLVWPAGLSGSRSVGFGVSPSLAQRLNTTSAWLRLSLTTTGAFTGSAWLSKPSDGGPGTGADVGDIFTGAAA
jgi:hypothetical protein